MRPLLYLWTLLHHASASSSNVPFVLNTWGGPFTIATDAAFASLVQGPRAGSHRPRGTAALDAVEAGCAACEAAQCDGTVGFGGAPDEQCETTLDALLMDGTTLAAGAVAGLRRVRAAIGVARAVLDHTAHTMLAGDLATAFAVQNGFVEEDLGTDASRERCRAWREADRCQGNYRVGVEPDPRTSCGPYVPVERPGAGGWGGRQQRSHDTVSMIVIDRDGAMAAGTSTNGAIHKIPGRVGDGPIVGSGSYVDGEVGGCGATGDGDIMMRFLPCYQAVENLRRGMTPTQAAEDAVGRMMRRFPALLSGVVVANTRGEHGGAASGWNFTYSFRQGGMPATEVVTLSPLDAGEGASHAGELHGLGRIEL